MKKILGLTIVLAFALAPMALAENNGSGCGLGKKVFEGQRGLIPNILAATTNGISGNQTFGMTSGTSGCDADAVVLQDKEQEVFVSANLDNLSQDMAQGQGQYVDTLATLMGCPVDLQGDFSRMTQAKYESLVGASPLQAKTFIDSLKSEMSKDAVLSRGCTRIA